MSNSFLSITHGELIKEEVLLLIKDFLEEDPKASYSVIIGSDSQEHVENKNNAKSVHVVTALVVYRKGYGGKYFWQKKEISNIHTLRQKVYTETMESLNFATEFVPLLQSFLSTDVPEYNLEIHIDVGEHGATREMIKEVVGMVTGSGFVAKTKPFSFAASNIADKHT